jgi:hypothetical protein
MLSSAARANLLADPSLEPIDASTAIPLPEQSREMIARAQGITSCTAATLRAAGTTAAQVNPPYTVTLTDLTPSTGQSEPNGEVGVDGIHGHRVEKVIRLRIQIRDQYGVEPTYPVLVHLATGGPHHGTLILDPDGARTECPDASFLWHERDAQGNLVALNEEFEYRMGTWSRYVGVEPDPNNPPQVKPVWGVAEDLEVRLETPDGAPLSYRVHPEPGKPDHFACWEGPNLPCGDLFAFWTGSFFSGETIIDAYHLEDGWGNATYGYTDTAATQPGAGVAVQFTDQTAGTAGNFAGYTLATQWPTNPAPSGQMPSTLSVDYPDDPAGDWVAGTVTKALTYDFSGGSSHVLIQKQNYDGRFGVDESAWPMTVSPGASEGALPKTAPGDTPRLVLLALSGSSIPSRIPAGPYYSIVGQDEPSLDPTHVYRNTGEGWNWVSATDQDAALEIGLGGEFRLSLVDGSGTVVPGTAFRVHRCPRGEHLTAEQPPGDCTLGPVDSEGLTGVLSSLTLNEAGGQRGYLGIELTKAPVNPGQYLIMMESIGSTPYRIRWQSQLFGRATPEEDLKGGFVICTVLGGEILDENFQRIKQLVVDRPRQVYVRIDDPTRAVSTFPIDVATEEGDGTPVDSISGVLVTRLGQSGVFLSGPVTIVPPQGLAGPAPAPRSAHILGAGQTIEGTTRPQGLAIARETTRSWAQAEIAPGIAVAVFVDTMPNGKSFHSDGSSRNPAGGHHPNLLYADGTSTTIVSAWIHYCTADDSTEAGGVPNFRVVATVADLTNGALLDNGDASTSVTTTTDANGWAQFTFQAAPHESAPTGMVAKAEVKVSAEAYPTASLASTDVFSYATYDFRNIGLTAGELSGPGLTVDRIQYAFQNFVPGQPSFLAHFFLKGETAGFLDIQHRCDPGATGCTALETDPAYDPTGSGDHVNPTIESRSAAQAFFDAAHQEVDGVDININPFVLIVRAQKEQSLLGSTILPSTLVLSKAMGYGRPTWFKKQLQDAALGHKRYRDEMVYGNTGEPVPMDGPFFFSSTDVPISLCEWRKVLKIGLSPEEGELQKDERFILGRSNVAFTATSRTDYVLFRYNNWVQVCQPGGGNRLFRQVMEQLRGVLAP